MDGQTLDEAKRALRAEVRARLRAQGPLDAIGSTSLQLRLLESGLLEGKSCVASYRALPSEPDTVRLEAALRERSVLVCHPRVRDADMVEADLLSLEFFLADGRFQPGPLRFDEPHPASARIALARIDAFIVPLLAADAQGNRLGRGRGHYDATLAANPSALRVGLLREAALVDSVPAGAHDQRLDALCTESRLIICPPRERPLAR